MRNFWLSELHSMEGAIGCLVMALLLVMQRAPTAVVGNKLVSNSSCEKSREDVLEALMSKANNDKTTAAAELNTRRGDLCFLSGLPGHCRTYKKVKVPARSNRTRRNAEHPQKNLRNAIAGVQGSAGGHGISIPRGYRNHPPNIATKRNGSSSTRPPSSVYFYTLLLAGLFYSIITIIIRS